MRAADEKLIVNELRPNFSTTSLSMVSSVWLQPLPFRTLSILLERYRLLTTKVLMHMQVFGIVMEEPVTCTT